jgi:hypothetical protein
VDLALVLVQVGAQLDMMADVLLQSFGIYYIQGFSTFVVNKRDFVTVCFHDAFDLYQLGLLFILAHSLRCSVREDRNPKCCYRKHKHCNVQLLSLQPPDFFKWVDWTPSLIMPGVRNRAIEGAGLVPASEPDGKSGEKFLFLLRTGSNLGGERNSDGEAGLYRKGHLEDIQDDQVRVRSAARAATRSFAQRLGELTCRHYRRVFHETEHRLLQL